MNLSAVIEKLCTKWVKGGIHSLNLKSKFAHLLDQQAILPKLLPGFNLEKCTNRVLLQHLSYQFTTFPLLPHLLTSYILSSIPTLYTFSPHLSSSFTISQHILSLQEVVRSPRTLMPTFIPRRRIKLRAKRNGVGEG